MGVLKQFFGLEQAAEEIPSFVPERRSQTILPPSRSETVINETTSLSLVSVTRAISVLETAVMQIPVEVFRGTTKIETPAWLETPDIENSVSQSEFVGTTLCHLATFGNAYWYITRGARGLSNLQTIHPQRVAIANIGAHTMGIKQYTVDGIVVPGDRIKHIKLWEKANYAELLGEGPIQRHKGLIRSAYDLQQYSDTWFRTSAVPTGTLSTTEFLSEDVAIANKTAFISSQQERSVAVLSSGLTYESIALNPEEAQFLENQKYISRQVANMFGVPSVYLGLSIEGQGMTYTNGNEDRNKLYEDGLQQYIVRIQHALSDLLPRGQYAKFNLTEFLRPNQLLRYQAYALGLTNKFLTVPEIREFEALPPIVVADVQQSTPEVVADVQAPAPEVVPTVNEPIV